MLHPSRSSVADECRADRRSTRRPPRLSTLARTFGDGFRSIFVPWYSCTVKRLALATLHRMSPVVGHCQFCLGQLFCPAVNPESGDTESGREFVPVGDT